MGHAHKTQKTNMRFKGEFDYQKFYSTFMGFFLSREFDFYEEVYKDKGNDLRAKWRFEREYDEYHRITFSTFFRVYGVTFKEKNYEKGKKTIITGRLMLWIVGEVQTNYFGNSVYDEKSKSDRFLMKITDAIRSREIEEYWEVLIRDLQHDIMHELKVSLGMTDT